MVLFEGEYFRTIDEKGRVNIPSEIRKQSKGKELYLIAFQDSLNQAFLLGTTKKKLEKILDNSEKFNESPIINCETKSQGRVNIGRIYRSLIEENNRKRECVFLGFGTHFAIYSPQSAEKILGKYKL